MTNVVRLKRSTTSQRAPTSLATGELALNHADRKVYVLGPDGATIEEFFTTWAGSRSGGYIEATGTGSSQNITLPVSGLTAQTIYVYRDGLKLGASEYSVSGTTLTITTSNGAALQVLIPPQGNTSQTTVASSNVRRPINALGNVSGTVTLDLSTFDYFTMTITAATTLALANPPTVGNALTVDLIITNAGAYTITYPTSWTFRQVNGTYASSPPTGHVLASGITEYSIRIDDGGAAPRVVV